MNLANDKIKHRVQLRGGFSDRNGINPQNTTMQYKDLDSRTRISLVNVFRVAWSIAFKFDYGQEETQTLIKIVLANVYVQMVDFDSYYDDKVFMDDIINTILNDDYNEVFTVLEYILKNMGNYSNQEEIYSMFNNIFEKEFVGYRFVSKMIVPITDENEVMSVNEVVKAPYESVRDHISKSLMLLSDRANPDYENSIKESISAVEAMCVSILGKGATLTETLKKLEKDGLHIHPSLKSAFEKLYGYTSDAKGVRHAGSIGGSSSTFDEAKFMLVSCSAFINYLISIQI